MTAIALAARTTTSVPGNRQSVYGENPGVLADIYEEDTNIAIWRRDLPGDLSNAARHILGCEPHLQVSVSVSPENACETLSRTLDTEYGASTLVTDIVELVDMFCCLFDLKYAGLRLTAPGHAMCPRFHVDKVPCRLVTTYTGKATEWLPHERVDRSKLGPGSQELPDDESGLYSSNADIQKLETGEVALLKGESWIGNENGGLVHRSPRLEAGERRLLLTLDIISQ